MPTLATSLPTQLVPGFQRSNTRAKVGAIPVFCIGFQTLSDNSRLRYVNVVSSQVKQRLPTLFASNTNPSSEDSLKEKSKGSESGDSQGPPFLTILAGFVVFLGICWIVGSIIMWLIGLIVNVPPSK